MKTYLTDLTLAAVRAESIRAHLKHVDAGGSIFDPAMPRELKLAALVEEVGEVARLLTYDGGDRSVEWTTADSTKLVLELIQVANVALTWAQCEDESSEGSAGA